METRTRGAALVLLLALPVTVLGIAHAVLAHLSRAGVTPTFSPWDHPEALPIALAGAGLLVPLAALCTAAWRWMKVEAGVDALREAVPIEVIAGEPVHVIGTPAVQLFAAGLRRPAIFATRAAMTTMTRSQLRAAVLHERSHIVHHDTRFRAVYSGLGIAMGWIPAVRRAVSTAILVEERRADCSAIEQGATRAELAGAILAVNAINLGPVTALSDSHVAARLSSLAVPRSPTPASSARPLALASLAVLALPLAAHIPLLCGL